jgi:hypothetical protein
MKEIKIKEFTVDRRYWLRGQGSSASGLLKPEGMCCVGFYCIAEGDRPVEELLSLNVYSLGSIAGDPFWHKNIYGTNDDAFISDIDREIRLKEAFNTLGITINFIN